MNNRTTEDIQEDIDIVEEEIRNLEGEKSPKVDEKVETPKQPKPSDTSPQNELDIPMAYDTPPLDEEPSSIDIDQILNEIDKQDEIIDNCGNKVKALNVGTITNIAPSKKVYPQWSPVVSTEEKRQDAEFFKSLGDELDKHGLFIESDPEDINLLRVVKILEVGDPVCNLKHGRDFKKKMM